MSSPVTDRPAADATYATDDGFGRVGPKSTASGASAVASSQHPIVTDTMLAVMRDGGNAADAVIAGALVQAVVQQDMTNHTGTVTALFYEAATGQVHELNSGGTIVPDLPPFAPVPQGKGLFSSIPPVAVIPGFMPGLKALHERYGTMAWSRLCEPAVHWAEEGHVVSSFEQALLGEAAPFYLYTASGREHFTPNGHLPQVGDRWRRPVLAETMRHVAADGPDHFITGGWARQFIERANAVGWAIKPHHMTDIPPRWGTGFRWQHGDDEVVQLSPPERQGVFCAIVLGILAELDITSIGHWSESEEALYYLAHALRRAHLECGFVNDPEVFADPSGQLVSPELIAGFARTLKQSRPHRDLSNHVRLTKGPSAVAASGASKQPSGSCELSVVDPDGNWIQLMNTLQGGGIPGEVVAGIPMVGSHATPSLQASISGWHTGGGRVRSVMGNTMVLRDGRPWLALGSPGNVHCTVPQVLSNILDFGMDPYDAEDAPRCLPYQDDHVISVESRVPSKVVDGLARMGVLVNPLPAYDMHMGSFQTSWRDADGGLHASVGPRREGKAGGF
jgi:gamma-glutamyltranspeptidase/glutathione hydrolase